MAVDSFRHKGFTLVELLVVILVISILVSLLLVGIQQSRGLARSLQCKNNLKQLVLACHHYADNHDGYWPGYSNPNGTLYWWGAHSDVDGEITFGHTGLLSPYLEQSQPSFNCPEQQKYGSLGFSNGIYVNAQGLGYGYNWFVGTSFWKYLFPEGLAEGINVADLYTPAHWSELESSTLTLAFSDSIGVDVNEAGKPDYHHMLIISPPFLPYADGTIAGLQKPSMHFRHQGDVCHLAWCAGGVGSVKMTYTHEIPDEISHQVQNVGFFGQDNSAYSLEKKSAADLSGVIESP